MKNKISILILGLLTSALIANAQHRLVYQSFDVGSKGDTSLTEVIQLGQQIRITSADKPQESPIPGMATHFTYVDYSLDTIIFQLYYSSKEQYYCGYGINKSREFEKGGTEKINGYNCTKYSITLYSNKIELWVTEDLKFQATSISGFAALPGVLVKYLRNGNTCIMLSSIKKDKSLKNIFPKDFGKATIYEEIDALEKEKLCMTYTIFDSAQICFNPKLAVPATVPYDTTLSFANGTVILKRVKMEALPSHYQLFAEVTEFSNGDAYDRTGSIFVIPTNQKKNFLQGLEKGIDQLPIFKDKEGNSFQGMAKTDDYLPPVELVRFFTPFGVRHYNESRTVAGQEWAKEVVYKQEITDLMPLLKGDVYIGAFIGNYDAGGHIVSLNIKAYPQDERWDLSDSSAHWTQPLFNTCNVMEMAGQNYGSFFRTDSLTVTFTVPANIETLKLRYITTGHGGWDNGDEFVPRANTILIDGTPKFIYTPWRSDCGTYRSSNPASGNFWNGTSSSDYSRSGWCPGTATQPVYFDLTGLSAGTHTMTIAIPEGEREGSSFSAWNVSGILIGTYKSIQ